MGSSLPQEAKRKRTFYTWLESLEFDMFGPAGSVEVNLPKRFNNRPAGYAFVVYETEEQANAAVEKLDKQGKSRGMEFTRFP